MSTKDSLDKGSLGLLFFSLLLWLLPLLSVNVGYYAIRYLDNYWQKIEQQNEAFIELEALEAASCFEKALARHQGSFFSEYQAIVNYGIEEEYLTSVIKSVAESHFGSNFVDSDLFLFRFDGDSANLFHHQADGIVSRRMLERVFEHLVTLSEGYSVRDSRTRQNRRMFESLIGQHGMSDTDMALTQKGRLSYSFYKKHPCRFVWNSFKADDGTYFGYMFFIRADRPLMHEVIKNGFEKSFGASKNLVGLLPVDSFFGEPVLSAELKKHSHFNAWAQELFKKVEKNPLYWLENGAPNSQQIGDHMLYGHIGRAGRYLAVIMMPKPSEISLPLWLKGLNFFIISLFVLITTKGLLLDKWPRLGLLGRFNMNFALASSLPLTIFVVVCVAYVNQYQQALNYLSSSEIQLMLRQFDSKKQQATDNYRFAFRKALTDPELVQHLKKVKEPDDKALEIVLGHFIKSNLSVDYVVVIDANGSAARFFAEEDKDLFHVQSLDYPIVNILREELFSVQPDAQLADPDFKLTDRLVSIAYNETTGNDMVAEINKRRSQFIASAEGSRETLYIHDTISVVDNNAYALLVVWDDSSIDEQIVGNAWADFALESPELSFVPWKIIQGNAELISPESISVERHTSTELMAKAKELALLAYAKSGNLGYTGDNYNAFAMTSQNFNDIVIVGAKSNHADKSAVLWRKVVLGFIFFIAFIIIVVCARLTAVMVITPITTIKHAVDKISAGEYKTKLVAENEDELAILANEFSQMSEKLYQHQRMSGLLSDQAVSALKKDFEFDSFCEQKFNAVAMVSDIRNFTTICEKYSPSEVVEMLNKHFETAADIIRQNGGRIYKFIGDAIEAVFEEDTRYQKSASLRAFEAASLMQAAFFKINQQRKKQKKFVYKAGVGLAYGKLLSGAVGSIQTRMDICLTGAPLKYAAEIESLSEGVESAIVTDRTVSEHLAESNIKLVKMSGKENVFYSDKYYSSISQGHSDIDDDETEVRQIQDGLRQRVVKNSSGIKPLFAFITGTIVFAAFISAMLLVASVKDKTVIDRESINADRVSQSIIEQFRTEALFRTAFEKKLNSVVTSVQTRLKYEDDKKDSELLKSYVQAQLKRLSEKFGEAFKYVLFLREVTDENQRHYSLLDNGFSQSEIEGLKRLSKYYFYERDQKTSLEHVEQFIPCLNDFIASYFGVFGEKRYITSHLSMRASRVSSMLRTKVFYWQNINAVSLEQNKTDSYEKIFKAGDINYRTPAVLFVEVDYQKLYESRALLIDSFRKEGIELALISESEKYMTDNFKQHVLSDICYGSAIGDSEEYFIRDDYVTIVDDSFRLVVAVKKPASLSSGYYFAGLFVWLGLIAVLYRLVYRTSILNRSLAARIWLSLFVAVILPLICLVFIFDFVVFEQFNLLSEQSINSLRRLIDTMELRESYAEHLSEKFSAELANCEQLKKIITDSDNNSKEQIKEQIEKWFNDIDQLFVGNRFIRPSQVIIICSDGTAVTQNCPRMKQESSEFDELMILSNKARVQQFNPAFEIEDGSDIRSEIVLDKTMNVIRALFGIDAYLNLASSQKFSSRVFSVQNGSADLSVYSIPDYENFKYVIFSTFVYDHNTNVRRIMERLKGDRVVFAILTNTHGALARSSNAFDTNHELSTAAAYVDSNGLSVSSQIELMGMPYMLEARRGEHLLLTTFVGLKSMEPVYEAISNLRIYYLLLLVVSVVLIIITANNTAVDILKPVNRLTTGMREVAFKNLHFRSKIHRNDELGQLCDSFDSMVKKLQESKLMQSMLSKSALEHSMDEQRIAKRSEVILMYIGIPAFYELTQITDEKQTLEELRAYVEIIAKTVLEAGGDIDKIMGDKMLAVFAIEKESMASEASLKALDCAKKIMKSESSGFLPYPCAIGINKGDVVSGFVGAGVKRDYTVIGDSVNLVARLESLAQKLRDRRLLVSESFFDSCSNKSAFISYGQVKVKGKNKLVDVYQIS